MKADQEALNIQEDDLIMLEALVKSPAFSALKRALMTYKNQCDGVLMTTTDTNLLYETRGRLLGLKIVENLPVLLVNRRHTAAAAEEKNRDRFKPKSSIPPKSRPPVK